MYSSFKVIDLNNDTLTVQYDGGSGILDGIIEYNVVTGKYKIIKYTSQHENSDVFVNWLVNKPTFIHNAKECYNTKKINDIRIVICCG